MSGEIDARRWSDICALFEELADLNADVQAARLLAIGSSDPELRDSVERLLRSDASVRSRLAGLEAAFAAPIRHLPDTDPLKVVGRSVAHFNVVEFLASGGMGVVYRAEDTRLGRSVALKFPLEGYQLAGAARDRFLNEARAAAALDHPNICSIYDTGEDAEGRLFLAMPLYDGETLKVRLAREGALPLQDAIDIARQMARGLEAAHKAGIVHRDIKPGNVMLLPDGTVKLLDFGLAKVPDLTFTTTRTRLGTVVYMAPEQIQGQQVDARTDLWALGVVLYEMLTGRRPFDGQYDIAIAHAVVHAEAPAPGTLRTGIPQNLDATVLRLLSKDRGKRFQTAAEVSAALLPVATPANSSLSASGSGRKLAAVLKHRSRTLSIALIVLAAVLVGAQLLTRADRRASDAPITVAVFPFEYLSRDPEHRYRAAGLTDACATELLETSAVVVPWFLSVLGYSGPGRTRDEIAEDLAAQATLQGSVQSAGDSAIVLTAQLFRPGRSQPVWSQNFTRASTNLVDIPGEIARRVIRELRVGVTANERERLERPPTGNGDAYDQYLRGRATELSGTEVGALAVTVRPDIARQALPLYARARDIDPDFALARAHLARTHVRIGATQAHLEQARLEAEAALRLQPDLSEAHEVMALYWNQRGDPDKSIEQLNSGLATSPNRIRLRLLLGPLYARKGRLEDAAAEIEQAMQLDRSNPVAAFNAALYYLRLRRETETMRAFDRALALAPDYHLAKIIKGHTILRSYGTPDTVAAMLRTIPPEWDVNGQATYARFSVFRAQRRQIDGLSMLDRAPSQLSRDGLLYHPNSLLRAQLYDDLNEQTQARAYYEVARQILSDSVKVHPNDPSIHASLGLALAGLGRKQEAIAEARRAMDLVPLSENAPAATAFMGSAVEVFARVGEIDAAMELLELLSSAQAGREVMSGYLRVWPGFDPLRADPRFEQLIQRFRQD